MAARDGRASPTTRRSRRSAAASLLDIRLETGRTHQIRVHMAAVRHPCVGDLQYGADPTLAARLGLTRQWLHAGGSVSRILRTAAGRVHQRVSPDLAHALAILRAEKLATAGLARRGRLDLPGRSAVGSRQP